MLTSTSIVAEEPAMDGPSTRIELPEPTGAVVVRRSFWGLADQGFVSLGSFLTNIVLARSLPINEYGSYALILGVMLFLNTLHASLVTYPLLVKGAASSPRSLSRLASGSVTIALALSPFHWIGVFIIAGLTGHLSAAPVIALALLLWQVQETLRRSLMAGLRFRDAVWGDAISYVGQAIVLWVLMRHGRQSLQTIFIVVAATSALAAVVQAIQIRVRMIPVSELWPMAKSFFSLGRWVAMSNLTSILNIQAVPWTLAAFHGVGESAKLAATGNILGVTHPALFGISNLIVPATSKAKSNGWKAAWRAALGYLLFGALLTLPYYLGVAVRPGTALKLFYGSHSPFLNLHMALAVFACAYMLNYAATSTGAILNGLEKTRAVFISQLAGAATTLCVSVPLAAMRSVEWALVGGCFSIGVQITVNIVALIRAKREMEPAPAIVARETEQSSSISPTNCEVACISR